MIIGYDFFRKDFHGNIWDTAIPTSNVDEVKIGAGVYDELYISVDTTIENVDERPTTWKIKNIMDAKFNGSLEAGTIGGEGHTVTTIQIYRRKVNGDNQWILIGEFPYDIDYNLYTFVDRLAENNAVYEYAIAPLANDMIGDLTISQTIKVNYEGVWISDLNNNFKLDFDLGIDTTDYNTNFSKQEPINGKYPVITFGSQNYKTGSMSFLPLSEQQATSGGKKIDGMLERQVRDSVVDFLTRPSAKVIRGDNGSLMVVATHNVAETPKEGALIDLADIKFSFTEVGEIDYETMRNGGLIGGALKSKYSFDDYGNIIWSFATGYRNILENENGSNYTRPRNSF